MGIFEKVLHERQPSGEGMALTPPYAFAAIVLGAFNADGRGSQDEVRRANEIFASTRLFRQPHGEAADTVVQRVLHLCETRGADAVASLAARSLPDDLRLPAFTLAVDLVLADGEATAEERTFIDELQARLQISDADAAKIVDVIIIKNSV
jgi:uncharacterized tellurite resistance protein B-like protein